MARFEQVVLADDEDEYGIPRFTGTTILNLDEVHTVHAGIRDTGFAAYFDPRCPKGFFPYLMIEMRHGAEHTLLLGQFPDIEEAEDELEKFALWLTGQHILT